jgi:tRNA modification GTPase
MLDRLDTTIVAISSAPGYGAMGIIRLSGPDAVPIADRMARLSVPPRLVARVGSTRASGEVRLDEELSLPAAFYLFRRPRSYTRQDIVEIYTVGSPAAVEMVRLRALEFGAVPAEPGEFTARAFLNGAMDLSSAEAVAGVIRAQTDTQLQASRRMMDGNLATNLRTVRNDLAELVALVEADIDFAEEPIDFITPQALRERLAVIVERLRELLHRSAVVERLDVLPHILLVGPPNVGKSSLMNRLSGTSRSICAAVAGTTRDILSAPIRIGRAEAILLDTAGVDRSEEEIIAEAAARTVSAAECVDLVCLVVDVTVPDDDLLFEIVRALDAGRIVIAANKCDLITAEEADRRLELLESRRLGPVCLVSALDGTGVDTLRDAFGEALASDVTTAPGEAVLISRRQQAAVEDAVETIGRAVSLSETARETIDCADLLALELHEALDVLGTVTGEVTTEDLLGLVFANFCIGK